MTDFKRPKLPDFRRMRREEIRRFADQFMGVFFAIPLDGEFCFGRVLRQSVIACYDLKSPTILPIEEVERAPVLFVATGAIRRVMGGRRWKILGRKPLEGVVAEPAKFFRLDVPTGTVDIYSEGEYRPYAGEDLSKIDQLCITIAAHVEEVLHHHFAGTVNPRGQSVRYDPDALRTEREAARARLAAGEEMPERIASFLRLTTEESLRAFAPKREAGRGR